MGVGVGVALTVACAALLTVASALGRSNAATTRRAAATPSLPACAYGTDVPGLGGYLSNAVATAADSYAAGPGGTDAVSQATARATFSAAAVAYVYGVAPIIEQQRLAPLTANTLVSVAALATPQDQEIVSPDDNIAPTVARVDLSDGPVVVDIPDSAGLFYTFEFLDAYTNAFAYLGSGSTGTQGGSYALEPPGYTGTLPAGVTGIPSPTNTVWLVGRTLVQNASELSTVVALQKQYALTSLSDWMLGDRQTSLISPGYVEESEPSVPTGTAFITALNAELALNPPPSADTCALQAMSAAGVQVPGAAAARAAHRGADRVQPRAATGPIDTAAVSAGTAFGAQVITSAATALDTYSDGLDNGWAMYGSWVGDYGTAYLARAIVAQYGLGANTPPQAIYPTATTDIDGQTLTGSKNYTITFPRGELPPVGAFWSLTMYGPSFQLTANQISRYQVGSLTPGLVLAPDGSLTLYIQNQEPGPGAERANWLPAPTGKFELMLRLYEPTSAALDGSWKPPPVRPPASESTVTKKVGAAPALSRLGIKPGAFRPSTSGDAESVHGPCTITYRDTEPATTDLTLIRLGAHGRRQVVAHFVHHDGVGTNRVRITGRAHGHALAAGRYLVAARAHRGSSVSTTITGHLRIL